MAGKNSKPPGIAEFILSMFMRNEVEKNRLGDFEEIYQSIIESDGKCAAWKWYWGQAILSIPGLIYNQIYWRITMLKNYLKMAIRNLRKHRMSSVINISSLAVTITACIFIFFYVWHEFNYDRFMEGNDRIYRIATTRIGGNVKRSIAKTTPNLIPVIKEKYPEVEKAARVFLVRKKVVKNGENTFYESGIISADAEFINIFSVHFVNGDPEKALTRPFTMVISQKIADKYFGKQNPLGRTLFINEMEFEITGVVEDCPDNSHLKYSIITSVESFNDIQWGGNWTVINCLSYVKLSSNGSNISFEKKIKNIPEEYGANNNQRKYSYFLQPVADIHLHSQLVSEIEPGGNISSIYIFVGVGLLILLLGCMNFINLSTAQSSYRTKEVGIRKVIGAQKRQILSQLLGESLLTSLIALLIALAVVILLIPSFNELAGLEIDYSEMFKIGTLSLFFAIIIIIGIVAGYFPSLLLSRYSTAQALKGYSKGKPNRNTLRKSLIVVQFVISNLLVIGTVIMFQQLNYLKTAELGFNKEQKMIIPAGPAFNIENYEALKNEFKKNPSVLSASVSEGIYGGKYNTFGVTKVNEPGTGSFEMIHQAVDYNYLSDYKIKLAGGRMFSKEFTSDFAEGCLINETAVKILGCKSVEEALGKKVWYNNPENIRTIIGVVKDFHYASLHESIKPLLIDIVNNRTGWIDYLNLTVDTANLKETIQSIRDKWIAINPGRPFSYFFLDEQFDLLYKKDEKLGATCGAFTFVALSIACFGLIGLISFTARKRIKEISVRKVLGASLLQLILVLSKETAKSVLIANVIAWPIAFFVMNRWLQDFPFRISISVWTLIFSGGAIFVISFLSISSHCIKTALANPVDSLRNE